MSRFGILAGLAVLVGTTACKDFTSSGDLLTQGEASELAEAIVGEGFPGFGDIGAAAPAMAPSASSAAPAEKITISINDSGPCEGGGTVALAGTLTADVNQQAETGTLEYKLTVSPNGCVVNAEGGKTFTLTGKPSLKGEGKLDWSANSFEGALKYSGRFDWTSSDGRAGACGVDLEANIDLSNLGGNNASVSVSGSVCGVNVDRSVTVES